MDCKQQKPAKKAPPKRKCVKVSLNVPDCKLSSTRTMPCSDCVQDMLMNIANKWSKTADCPFMKITGMCSDKCPCDAVEPVDTGPACPFAPKPCTCCPCRTVIKCPLTKQFPDCPPKPAVKNTKSPKSNACKCTDKPLTDKQCPMDPNKPMSCPSKQPCDVNKAGPLPDEPKNCTCCKNNDENLGFCPLDCPCEPPRTFHVPTCPIKKPKCLQAFPTSKNIGELVCPFSPNCCPLGPKCPFPVPSKKKSVAKINTSKKSIARSFKCGDSIVENFRQEWRRNEGSQLLDQTECNVRTKSKVSPKDSDETPPQSSCPPPQPSCPSPPPQPSCPSPPPQPSCPCPPPQPSCPCPLPKPACACPPSQPSCPPSEQPQTKKNSCPCAPPCPLDIIKPLPIKETKPCSCAKPPSCPLTPKCQPSSKTPASQIPECPLAPPPCPLAPKKPVPSKEDGKCPCPKPPCPIKDPCCPCSDSEPDCPCSDPEPCCPCSDPGQGCPCSDPESCCPPKPPPRCPLASLHATQSDCPLSEPAQKCPLASKPSCPCSAPSECPCSDHEDDCPCGGCGDDCPLKSKPKYPIGSKPDPECPLGLTNLPPGSVQPELKAIPNLGKIIDALKNRPNEPEDCPVKLQPCEKFPKGRCPMEDLGLCDCDYPCPPCMLPAQCGNTKAPPQYCANPECVMGLPLPPVVTGAVGLEVDSNKPKVYYKFVPTKPDKKETKYFVEIMDRPPNEFPFGMPREREHPNWSIIRNGKAYEKCKTVAEKLNKKPPFAENSSQYNINDNPMDEEMRVIQENKEKRIKEEQAEANRQPEFL